ncbi:hypothetical protein C7450_11678 [Chelatococcus asaccharovorans]|uniref:Uncharacterized protein n=1 Tax=Chelatococcus asaccharovorans TaxID=28210 RepID=A0A2V3TVY8_9HYPH|nr:hypothetical protein C7450_11678 [Chelatococcus asaccharovorans]
MLAAGLHACLRNDPHRLIGIDLIPSASKTSLVRVAVRIKSSNASLADRLLSVAYMAWMNAGTLS